MKALFPILAASTLLAGCDQVFGPKIGCADPDTVKLVKQVFDQELERQLQSPLVGANAGTFRQGLDVSLGTVLADSYDEKVKRHECRAELAVTLPARAREMAANPFLGAIFGDGVTSTPEGAKVAIRYSSQLTADGKQQYVEVQGHAPLASSLAGLSMLGAFASAPSGPAPAAAAAPAPATPVADAGDAVIDAHRHEREVEGCVSQKVNAFRADAGEEAVVRTDMLDEWTVECGGTP